MAPPLICQDVSKRFPVEDVSVLSRGFRWLRGLSTAERSVVDRVSFEVAPGEILGILGPNGSGKSTLIRMIATLLVPDEGTIRVFGHDVTRKVTEACSLMNRVSVEAALFKKLSAVENLLFTGRVYGLERATLRDRIVELLTAAGFDREQMETPVETFSRGMQQKVAIARALLTRPKLLLLDEPTTGLDPRSKLEVQRTIQTMRFQTGAAILLTTHDMEEADRLCDRVAIISKGRFVALDSPSRLKRLLPAGAPDRSLEAVFLHLTGGLCLGERDPDEQEAA